MLPLLIRFGPLAAILGAVGAALSTGAADHLSLAQLEAHRQSLIDWSAAHPHLSIPAFILAYVVMAAVALPGPLIFTLAGGMLFGPWIGSLAVLAGATGGSCVLFMACRSALGDLIQRRAGPRLAKVEALIRGRMFEHILILRLLPVFPLGVITIASALVGARLRIFAAASALGMVPSTLIYTSIGSGLNRVLDEGGRLAPELLRDPAIILPLAGLGVLAALPVALRIFRHFFKKRPDDSLPDAP